MSIEILLVILIIVLIAGYFIGNHLKKKHYETIDKIDKEKNTLFSRSIAQKFYEADKISLAGQSRTTYENLSSEWHEIETVKFPELENCLFEAEHATDRFLFSKATIQEEKAHQLIQETSSKMSSLSDS